MQTAMPKQFIQRQPWPQSSPTRGRWLPGVAAFVWLFATNVALAAESADSLEDALMPLITAHDGTVAVAAWHPASGARFEFQADRLMPTASLIKLPVMVATYAAAHAGEVSLDDMLRLSQGDLVPGSRTLDKFSPGASFSLRDAVRLMIAESDNTATNLVLSKVRIERVNATMAQLGLESIRLHSPVYRGSESIDAEGSRQFGLGRGTAKDFMQLASMIESRELETRGIVADDASAAMLDHLRACEDRAMSPRDLPARVRVAHKTGFVSSTRTDAGVIETKHGPILFCILTADNRDRRGPGGAADDLAAAIASELVAYAAASMPSPTGPLTEGAEGELVTDLQRSLNKRLPVDATLTVDGAFGPATAGAVRRFQQEVGLPATGMVDKATWQALSPLATEIGPLLDASEPKQPADDPDAPPTVTAKGWIVVEGETGRTLAGAGPDHIRQPASIVKVMTAVLVLEAANGDAAVLEEVVHVSERAGTATGSSAGLRPGDTVVVGDLLYGLLLPSGNDAAVALAEHFGPRLTPEENSPHDQFVDAMNTRAEALGLSATRYGNPHGKTVDGCGSSPRDTAALVRHALALPGFRELVGTRERTALIANYAGYSRPVAWRNTNRLLAIEGYHGVKTGTTFAAGCCLAACSVRDGQELIVVVFGSSSTEARYSDTRNLFRHGWQQLNSSR